MVRYFRNSLWPSDAIWHHKSWPSLFQVHWFVTLQCQVINCAITNSLLIGPLATNHREIRTQKMSFKMSAICLIGYQFRVNYKKSEKKTQKKQ